MKTNFKQILLAFFFALTSTFGLVGCDQIDDGEAAINQVTTGIGNIGKQIQYLADLMAQFNKMVEAQTQIVAQTLRTKVEYVQSFDVENLKTATASSGASQATVQMFYVKPDGSELPIAQKSFDTSGLSIGAKDVETLSTTFNQAGTYKEVITADATKAVQEWSEDNNNAYVTFGNANKTEEHTFVVEGTFNPNLQPSEYVSFK